VPREAAWRDRRMAEGLTRRGQSFCHRARDDLLSTRSRRLMPNRDPSRGKRSGSERACCRSGLRHDEADRRINVKSPLLSHRWHGRFTPPFMVQRRLTRTNVPRLGRCLAALRALAKSRGPHRSVLVERHIDDYLRTDPFSLAHALERLRRAIHYEELERREGEDWSIAKDYVRSLLRRMT
jgi:hypothetical protein